MSAKLVSGLSLTEWKNAREAYAYPSVCLVAASGPTKYLCLGRYLEVDLNTAHSPTGEVVENHHRQLLLSRETTDQWHGIASVQFWGFYGSADPKRRPNMGRALKRAEWILSGRAKGTGQRANVEEILDNARHLVMARKFGDAWREYYRVPNVGPSFASKMVAFADPINAAVLDSVVQRNIENGFLGAPDVKKIDAKSFANWCDWCRETAEKLNDASCDWAHAGKLCQWRAIDVERAVFGLNSNKG